jgi:HAD superfamily hydrolase (TIGR01548 family)
VTTLTSHAPRVNRYQAILFDMDGVLVDVTDSYRKAIQETVKFFTGKLSLPTEIQALKEKGGYNNDWDLTEAILVSRGKLVLKAEIIGKFQEIYWGTESKRGLIDNEKWLLPKEQLVKLRKKHYLGIVTGRPREETWYTLRKFGVDDMFDVLVAMEDYPTEKAKPDPYPIKLALEKLGVQEGVYVGDSIDDITAAKLAGIQPTGCIPPGVSENQLRDLLLRHGAKRVLDNIRNIDEVLN